MNTKLGFIKLTALAAVCALGFGVASTASADGIRFGHHGGWNGHSHGHSHFNLSINLGEALFGGGYYNAPRYRSRDPYYDDYNYYDNYNNRNYNNYDRDYGYYNGYPQFSIGYSNYGDGYDNRRGHDRDDRGGWDRDRGGRGGWGGDHDQHGGWDRDHYYNDQGGSHDGHRHRHW